MKYLFVVIFFILCFHFSYAQVLDTLIIQVQYKYDKVKDSSKLDQKTTDLMRLDIGQRGSTFYSYNTFRVDSLIKLDMDNNISSAAMLANRGKYGRVGEAYKLFKNYPLGKITITDKLVTDDFKYIDNLEVPKWTLVEDYDSIMHYSVQKATADFRGRSYVAWFTQDLPISDGPWKFSGLPGLILKVYDTENQFEFEAIDVENMENKNQQIVLDESKAYIVTTKNKFDSLNEKFQKDPVGYINNHTSVKVTRKDGSDDRKERAYNPIER